MTASETSPTQRIWMTAGAIAFMPHLAAVIVATRMRPSYDHGRQFLSELGERGSTTSSLMNFFGIIPTGLLIAAFGIGLAAHLRKAPLGLLAGGLITLHGLSRMLVGVFPCDVSCVPAAPSLSQTLHNTTATAGYVSLTAAAFVFGAFLIVSRRHLAMILVSYGAGIVASVALGFLLMHPGASAGLYQRLALGTLQLWLTVVAISMFRFTPARSAA